MEPVVYKTIKTAGGQYIYDRGRNTLIKVSDDEFNELEKVEMGKIQQSDSRVLKKYQSQDYLLPNAIKYIEHPCSKMLGHYLMNHMEQLTLQVTQRCNLRCQYCTYGGFFGNNRVHSNIDMNYETAIRAIDFYISHSMESKHMTFGFYGGEPLLKIDLIKQCVEYIKSKVCKDRQLLFTITTNGTLLKEEVVKYLFENDFKILISLDGSQKEHDEYRVFPDGRGSFDIIMDNLKRIQKLYPDLLQKVQFNTVLNPNHDYKHLKLFFDEDELMGNANVMMTLVNTNSADKVIFGDEFYRAKGFDRFKLFLWVLGKLEVEHVPTYELYNYSATKANYDLLSHNRDVGNKAHHSGPCIPGGRRAFVNVYGDIFPCERVDETSSAMKIGHLSTGFDIEKANSLLNVGSITENECKKCWALFYCGLCCRHVEKAGKISRSQKLKYCKRSKEDAYYSLAEICSLSELGCVFNEKGVSDEIPFLPDEI